MLVLVLVLEKAMYKAVTKNRRRDSVSDSVSVRDSVSVTDSVSAANVPATPAANTNTNTSTDANTNTNTKMARLRERHLEVSTR